MQIRNTLKILAAATVFEMSCGHTKPSDHKKDFVFTAIIDRKGNADNLEYAKVKTLLSNNTDDTIKFIDKSCSYYLDYETDSKYFWIFEDPCLLSMFEIFVIPHIKILKE